MSTQNPGSDRTDKQPTTVQFEIADGTSAEGSTSARVTEVEPGTETRTVTDVRVCDFRDELTTRLPGDYPEVWLVGDGTRLCICDHEKPIPGSDQPALADQPPGVHRIEVVESGEQSRKSLFDRRKLRQALERFADDERVSIHLNEEHPLVIVGDEEAVVIAPRVKQPAGEQA